LLGTDDLAVDVRVLSGGADHVLFVDSPGLFGEHAHKVAATAGANKYSELVRLEETEQLEHWLVYKLDISHT
jgi:hypothetical protein